MSWLYVVLGLLALVAMLASRAKRKGKFYPESYYVVQLNELGVSCTDPKGTSQSVAWADLASVLVVTNDTGPWGTDVYWVFQSSTPSFRVVVPGGATGEHEVLAQLQRLPGFNIDAVISAMGCTSNRTFTVWEGHLESNPLRPGA